ncbi:MAG: radical SAM protein [Phycisphaerales bacterium]|nr:MAG: radical SAM protein [Phycisphaerales bacterium]
MQDEPTHPDALVHGPAHRRGAGLNPANRFEPVRLHVLGEALDRQWVERACDGSAGEPVRVERQVFEDKTRRIINRVSPTSDVPFRWTVNPYRGCEHGCIYCFARPFHEYLGFSCGLDFETKLLAKPRAAELLEAELAAPGWKGEPIVMSAITDVYQPIEHKLGLARRCLEVLARCNQPVSTMTKSAMVLRDVDLWQRLAAHGAGRVTITLVTLDGELARRLEPRASAPSARLRAIAELTRAGVPVTVNVAPIIPGLTDAQVPEILRAVADAGATHASWVLLRLPYQLKALFLDWLDRSVHPQRAKKVASLLRQMHGGRLYDAGPLRGRGHGPIAEQIARTFDLFARRYGLDAKPAPLSAARFRKPCGRGQLGLFDALDA